MKFLFFDLECACTLKGGRGVICEFGYVLTDERFEVLERDVFLINPEKEFNNVVIEKMLAFKQEEYEAAPNFAAQYKKIKALFEEEDIFVIGHTVGGDARCLNYAARRYELPYINFDFYDLKQIYKHRKKITRSVGLEHILQDLKLEFEGHVHRSDDDAYATMLAVKELCRLSQVDGAAFIAEYVPFKGTTADGKVTGAKVPPYTLTEEEAAEREEERRTRLENNAKVRKLRRILEGFAVNNTVEQNNFFYLTKLANGQTQGKILESRLKGKSVLIDRDYQKMHFKEMISLIWLIKRHGGKCVFYPNQCDVFVNGVPDDYPRKHAAYLRCAERNNAEIITLAEFLSIFNVTEEGLYKMPLPPYEAFRKKKSVGENK